MKDGQKIKQARNRRDSAVFTADKCSEGINAVDIIQFLFSVVLSLDLKIVQVNPCQSLVMRLNNGDLSMTKSMQRNMCKCWYEAIALYGLIFTHVWQRWILFLTGIMKSWS